MASATVKLPPVLRPQTGGEATVTADGDTVGAVLGSLVDAHPDTRQQLFAAEGARSNTVTSVTSPVDSKALVKMIRERSHVIIAGGQSELEGKIFRLGHMGMCQLEQLLVTLTATAEALSEMGVPCDAALAVEVARQAYV